MLHQALSIISNPSVNSNWGHSPELHNSGQNCQFFVPRDLEIWWMTLKNNRAPLLYNVKLCASFQIHRWFKIWVTVRKLSIWVKIADFLSRVTLKFDGWPWKTIMHLFYTTSSFVQHFKAIGIFKLGVTVRKRSIRVKIADFLSRVTSKIDEWPWKTIGHLFYTTSFVHHFKSIGDVNLGQNWQFFVPCDLEIWWMTLKNNRASLPYYIKLCAAFQSHCIFKLELQSGNAPFRPKLEIFCPVWPWKLTDDLEKL